MKLLPALLSMVAGSADAISFLGLGGLFVAQITGNVIILVAHLVTGAGVHVNALLSVPMFILALILTRVLVARLKAIGIQSLRPLLVVQLVLLAGFLTLGVAADARVNPDAPTAVLAAMLGVSAMAAQNALVQISVRGGPTTAVMTTDITRFTMDVGEILLGNDPSAILAARRRASHTWPAILGFAVGAALGAGLYAILGLASLVLPPASPSSRSAPPAREGPPAGEMKRGRVSLVRVGVPLPATSGIPGRPLWRMRMYESDG